MIYKKINLKKIYPLPNDVYLEILSPVVRDDYFNNDRPLAFILAGGGYAYVSNREKDPGCIAFLKEGYVAASLTYTCTNRDPEIEKRALYPIPHLEVLAAMDYLKRHYKKYHFNKDKIVMVGFSAGGHLSASYSYLYNNKDLLNALSLEAGNRKPNYLVLAYPVITMKEFPSSRTTTMSRIAHYDEKLVNLLSVEKHIDKDYPVTFVWNTKDDEIVPKENIEYFTKALKENHVKYKLVQFEHGRHGLSLNDINTEYYKDERFKYKPVTSWFNSCIKFLDKEMKRK